MNILCIGNSFSQNSTNYLHDIAKCNNDEITTVNLFIGGCSLLTHYQNMLGNKKAYPLYFNGENTCFRVSLEEALLSRQWDYITLQQVSHKSPYYRTYQPYLNTLFEYVKKCAPQAKICIHQTWAYEEGSNRLCCELKYTHRKDMFADIESSYDMAAKDISAYTVFRSGELIEKLFDTGIKKLHADTFHLNETGCYAVGLLWYKALTGKIPNKKYLSFLPQISENDANIIHSVIEN